MIFVLAAQRSGPTVKDVNEVGRHERSAGASDQGLSCARQIISR